MIKIDKDLTNVPDSIQVPLDEYFPNGIVSAARTTHDRRSELISAGKYIDSTYDSRYKQKDTQTALREIYSNKCAFCEQKVEQSHIEHYRPKSEYWWIAYSWDNLLLACPTCNIHKGKNFAILGNKAVFVSSPANLRIIHLMSGDYDRVEQPKMVNPEVTNPNGKIQFQRNGMIESTDDRFRYTIETCKIDREYLNDERRKILDVFKRDVKSAILENKSPADQEAEIGTLIRKFVRDSNDAEFQFLAFRRYAVSNWLKNLVAEVKPD